MHVAFGTPFRKDGVRGAPELFLSRSRIQILDFSFDGGAEHVMKCH